MNYSDSQFQLSRLDDAGTFVGIASEWSRNRNGWQYEPTAFVASLAEHRSRGTMPAMLLYHDSRRPVGRWDAIDIRADGLHVSGTIARDTTDGAEAYALLRSRALQALSTGCVHLETKQAPRVAGQISAEIVSKADLFEISLVSVPANPNTKIVRVNSLNSVRDLEEVLQSAGLSSRKAKAGAAAAWRAIQSSHEPDTKNLETILSGAIGALAKFHGSEK